MSLTIEQHEAAPARDVGLDRRPGISHRRLNEKAARCDRAALLIRGSDRPLFDIVKPCWGDWRRSSVALGSHQRTIGASQVHLTPRLIIDALGPFDLDPCSVDPGASATARPSTPTSQ